MRYSPIYDEFKHRRMIPNCPALDQVREQVVHAKELWRMHGDEILGHIRNVTRVVFPQEPTVIYLIGCGRGISDPITVSLYTGGPDGPFKPKDDEAIIRDITHELLHQVANLPDYEPLQERLYRAYPHESSVAFNHILVAAFETRIYGYTSVAAWYVDAEPDYRRALEIAKEFNLTTEKPLPD